MPFQQLLGLLLAFVPLLTFAHPGRPIQRFGCGASPSDENLAAISHVASVPLAHSVQAHKRFDGFPFGANFTTSSANFSSLRQIEIDTWIHILAENRTEAGGWIPVDAITAQVKELNANFAPQKFKFILKGVTRTINVDWANDVQETALTMKRALRKGDYKTLNIYFHKYVTGGYGYARFPGSFAEDSIEFFLDGVNILASTVPGGADLEFNLGRTATHEVGHWLGLLHTFQETDCSSPTGDLIADTPAQNWPTSGCPETKDSCSELPGLDPIHNYMDYSYDRCYTEFTPLQTKRMHDIWHAYRAPRTCNSDNCLRILGANTAAGRLDESTAFCGAFTKVIVSDVTVLKPYMVEGCAAGVQGDGGLLGRVSSACTCLPSSTAGVLLPSLVELPVWPTEKL